MSVSKKSLWFAVPICLGLVCSSLGSSAEAEEVKIGAGAAPTENVFSKIMEPMEKAIGLKVFLVSNGPAAALKDLDEGVIDAAAGGLTFQDWMAMMEKEGYHISDKSVYKYRVIGKDIIKVIVHKNVTIQELSKEQLKGIFSGKIVNWKEAGGADIPIVVVWGNKIPGTNSVFGKQIMDGQPYLRRDQAAGFRDKNFTEVDTAAEIKQKVSTTPGAVGLVPLSLVDSSIAAPVIPEVGRPITLITKGAPSPAIVKMLDYISGEGQKHLAR